MLYIFLSILLGAAGQIYLKLSSIGASQTGLLDFYFSLAKNKNLWLGFGCYGVSFLIWLKVLSKYDLSFARPLVGLGYVLAAFLSWWILGEEIVGLRWLGIFLIVFGVFLVGLTYPHA